MAGAVAGGLLPLARKAPKRPAAKPKPSESAPSTAVPAPLPAEGNDARLAELQQRFEARGAADLAKRDFASAERALSKALQIAEGRLGEDSLELCLLLGRIADTHYHQRKYAEAEAPMRRVIELNEAHRGATHVETARAVNNLATLLRMRKRHAEARPLMERALEASDESLGPEHPNTVRTLGNFVDLLDEGGDKAASELLLRERAERAERRAADIRSAEGGNTDEEGDEAEAKVGTAEVVSGEVAEEEEGAEDGDDTPRGSAEYRAALAASSKARSRLAGVLLSHGKTFEAEAEYVKALDQADAAHGVKNAEAAAVA